MRVSFLLKFVLVVSQSEPTNFALYVIKLLIAGLYLPQENKPYTETFMKKKCHSVLWFQRWKVLV
jgi:hypothetical protein